MNKKNSAEEMELVLTDYTPFFNKIVKVIEQSKVQAYTKINKVLLETYWGIGKELSENSQYGKSVVKKLSEDLRFKFPGARGYSVRNLWNMKLFYETYQKVQTVSADLLFSISWSNHVCILDKTQSDEWREI